MPKPKPPADVPLRFTAAFAPHPRKAFSMDTEGETVIVLVVPASDAFTVTAAFQALKEQAFTVTLTPA